MILESLKIRGISLRSMAVRRDAIPLLSSYNSRDDDYLASQRYQYLPGMMFCILGSEDTIMRMYWRRRRLINKFLHFWWCYLANMIMATSTDLSGTFLTSQIFSLLSLHKVYLVGELFVLSWGTWGYAKTKSICQIVEVFHHHIHIYGNSLNRMRRFHRRSIGCSRINLEMIAKTQREFMKTSPVKQGIFRKVVENLLGILQELHTSIISDG